MEITFDCNFGNEFDTIRNVPGSLGVVTLLRGGSTETQEMTPKNLSLSERVGWWIQKRGKLDGGLKLSKLSWRMNLQSFKIEYENEPHLHAFSRVGGVAIRMSGSRLC